MPVQTRFHIRRKVFALGVCLLFSGILWLLNDLARVQTTTVQIPVRFTGLPYDMVTTNSLPSTMEATVEATGFTLLWRSYSSEKEIVEIPLRLEQGGVSPGRNYLFNINYYMQDISEALGTHLKIRRIFPDTFSITFEKKCVKKVPIVLSSDIQFEKEFYASGNTSLQPESVIISGTKENLAAIDSISTQKLSLKALKTTWNGKVELEKINGISYSVEQIEIKLPVEQYTEKIISLEITPTNVPRNYELNTIPDMVTLKLLVPISAFNAISKEQFIVSAEFPVNKTGTNKILLNVNQKPAFVKLLSIDPLSVEYKIKQKE
jgi:YbbR domain-containing protein